MTVLLNEVLAVRKADYEAEQLEAKQRRDFDRKQAEEKVGFELRFFIPRVIQALEKALVKGDFRIEVPFRDVGARRNSCLQNTNFIDNVSGDNVFFGEQPEEYNEIKHALRALRDSGYVVVDCGAVSGKFVLEWEEKHALYW